MNNQALGTTQTLQQLQALIANNQPQLGGLPSGGLSYGGAVADPLLGGSEYLKLGPGPTTPSWGQTDLTHYDQTFRGTDTLASQLTLQHSVPHIGAIKDEATYAAPAKRARLESDSQELVEEQKPQSARGSAKASAPASMKEKNREAQRRFRERQKTQIQQLQNENQLLTSDCRKYQSQIEVLRSQVENFKQMKLKLEEELGATKAAYEEKLADREAEIQQLRSKLPQYEF